MYVIASFKLNKNPENAIAELEYMGIIRKNILALPLSSGLGTNRSNYRKCLFELAPILGTIFALFGAIYGFLLHWGPVLWGLLGLGLGIAAGLGFDLLKYRRIIKNEMSEDGKLTEVFLMVHCRDEAQLEKSKDIVWKWSPLRVSTFKNRLGEGVEV